MYDFRHISCCYWLPRYKSESALKYRFGWKGSDKIHYYSELLGMRDTIAEEDLFIDVTKTEIEKELLRERKEKDLMREELDEMKKQMTLVSQLQRILMIKSYFVLNSLSRQFCLNVTQPTELSITGTGQGYGAVAERVYPEVSFELIISKGESGSVGGSAEKGEEKEKAKEEPKKEQGIEEKQKEEEKKENEKSEEVKEEVQEKEEKNAKEAVKEEKAESNSETSSPVETGE